MTLIVSGAHLLLLVLVSCLDEATIQDPFGECPPPRSANAIGMKNQFFPYENSRYSLETDTVLYEKFGIVLELTPELLSENQAGDFSG